MKFTKKQEKQICKEYLSKKQPSLIILAKRWNCSGTAIKGAIIRNGFILRTNSESHKGHKAWNKGLTKETNDSLKKASTSRKKFSKGQEKQICKQYIEDKVNTLELAKIWGCSHPTIGNILKMNGYKLRTNSESHKGQKWSEEMRYKMKEKNKRFSKKQELQICKEYFSKKKPSITVLGKKWNCDPGTISCIIKRNNYKPRTPSEIGESQRKFIKEEEKQICDEYFSDEKSATDTLAKKWGCSSITIIHMIKRNGYKLRTISEAGKMFTKEEEQQICKEYFSEKKPGLITLGKKWNCSDVTIRYIIKRNGYTPRTQSEALHPLFKNGVCTDDRGYRYFKISNHPRANKEGYVAESILIKERLAKDGIFI